MLSSRAMRHAAGRLLFSATDLSRHLSCAHLTSLRRAAALGEIERPTPYDDPRAEVLKQRGIEHERRLLERFAAEGRAVEIVTPPEMPFPERDPEAAAARTREAMRRGVDVVYQGRLQDDDGRWSGYPDFLLRVDEARAPGGCSYEVVDAKLARVAKGEALLQLLLYSDLLARLQGTGPEWMHLAAATGLEKRASGSWSTPRTTAPSASASRRTRRSRRTPIRSRSTIVRSATGSRAVRIADAPTITCRWLPGSRAASGASWSTGA